MHSKKARLKWTKVQSSKPKPPEAFAFEAMVLMCLCQAVSDVFSENDWRILLQHTALQHISGSKGHFEIAFENFDPS